MTLPSHNITIYLVDDDADDQEILSKAILKIDPCIQLQLFENGKDLIQCLHLSHYNMDPSLLIIDYNMPYYNGAEILKKLQDQQDLLDIPKIIWSTANDSMTKEECINSGAVNYYQKPYTVEGYTQLAANILNYIKK